MPRNLTPVCCASAAPAQLVLGMRTSYALDLKQLLELLEDVCHTDLERPLQIASTADGDMTVHIAPGNGTCWLQIDVTSLQGPSHSKGSGTPPRLLSLFQEMVIAKKNGWVRDATRAKERVGT